MMPPRKTPKVEKLSDDFGQYKIMLTCKCGHSRQASPSTLARFAGWDAKLTDVVDRMRCSQCGKRQCTFTVRSETKRDEG
jgi:hypothetical protein